MTYLFLLIGGAICAQSIDASAKIDRKNMRLGEQTTFTLNVNYNDSIEPNQIVFPDFENGIPVSSTDTNFTTTLEVVETFMDTASEQSLQRKYIVTSWDTGTFFIDSIQIQIGDTFAFTNTSYIRIGDVPVDTTKDIVDIKEIYDEEVDLEDENAEKSWLEKNWIWLTIVGVLLIAGILGWFFYFRKEKEVIEVKAKLPAHQIALQRLASVKKKDYIKKGQEKEYYSEISEILRVYLEDRYGVKALELTTNEIITRLKYENISPDQKFSLKELFEIADLVKFAKAKPTEMDNENTLYKAEEFVRNTKKVIVESENDDENLTENNE